MKTLHILLALASCNLALPGVVTAAEAAPKAAAKAAAPKTIEWLDLMSKEDIALLENAPSLGHDGLSEEALAADDSLAPGTLKLKTKPSAPASGAAATATSRFEQPASASTKPAAKVRTWRDALVSTQVRPEFNNQRVRLPGYLVPLEHSADKKLTRFFLVPYFGACIHVPPPPPNQIIYVRTSKPFAHKDIYTPYWISGRLKVESVSQELGDAAYSMDLEAGEIYVDGED
jgi:uncharacterized protein